MTNFPNNFNGSINAEDKDVLISEIRKLFSSIIAKHTSEEDEERQWLLQNCKNPIILKLLHNMSGITVHVLDAIGQLEPVNSITISKNTGIPKGTVSKAIKKLISQELIIKTAVPDNKKEMLFYITPLGKEIFQLHQALHRHIDLDVITFLKKYDHQELKFLIEFLKDFSEVTFFKGTC